jgi:molybdenum cofactor cytidylyltransferase
MDASVNPSAHGRRVFALVPAAGLSRRMGKPKQLLHYRDGTILEAVINSVLESTVDGLGIVASPTVRDFLGSDLPERCFVAVNADGDSEMIQSIQIGVREMRSVFEPCDDDGIMILPGDQPQISGGVITTCAEAYRLPRRPPDMLIAAYAGRRGHPAIYSFSSLREVESWGPQKGLNELARRYPERVRELPIVTTPMPIDVNTPEDYDRLRGLR